MVERKRDTQYAAFMRAIAKLDKGKEFTTVRQAQSYANQVLRTQWWQKRSAVREVVVKVNKANVVAIPYESEYRQTTIELGLNQWTQFHLLRQMCFLLIGRTEALHGVQFCQTFAEMVGRFMGTEAKKALKLAYRAAGVKYWGWSDKARQSAKQRIVKNDLIDMLHDLKPKG